MDRRTFLSSLAILPASAIQQINPTDGVGGENWLLVNPQFEDMEDSNRFPTIEAAMSAATVGSTILVSPGVYEEDVVFSQNGIRLIGGGQPYFNGTDMLGGTTIKGRINCISVIGTLVTDLGIDIRETEHKDAVMSSSKMLSFAYQSYERLTIVGKGAGAEGRGHGILFAGGDGNYVQACRVYNCYNGIVFRCSFSRLSDCYFHSCLSNSVLMKAAADTGDATNNVICNCICVGVSASPHWRAGPIRIQATNGMSSCYNVVSNISFVNSGEAAILLDQLDGIVAFNSITGITCRGGGDSASRAEFDNNGSTNNTLVNCYSVARSRGVGIRNRNGGQIRTVGCTMDLSGEGQYDGDFADADFGYSD